MQKTAIKIFLIGLFAIFLTPVSYGEESSVSEIDILKQQIVDKNAEIKRIEEEIEKYKKQIEETGKEASSLKGLIKQLEVTKGKLTKDIGLTEKKIQSTSLNINKLGVAIQEKRSKIELGLDTLEIAVRKTNELDLRTPVEMLLSNENLYDGWNDLEDLARFQGKVDEKLEELKTLKRELEKDKVDTEKEKKNLVSLKSQLSDQKKIVELNTKEKNKVLTETKNKESEYKKLLADRLKKKEELEREILEFESKLRVDVDLALLPKAGTKALSWPLDNPKLTQYFGNTPFATENPQVYNGMGHNGIDLKASPGTPIKAAASGIVVDIGNTDLACDGVSYGKWVLVRHQNGLSTLYAHLSLIKAVAGEAVLDGEILGYSGNTGYSTGPHLHFSVYASQAVKVSGPTEYKSKVCKTYMKLPIAPRNGYLNPLSYL